MNLCTHCQYHSRADQRHFCHHETSPVDGATMLLPCEAVRATEGMCGKEGKWWVLKEGNVVSLDVERLLR